MKTKKTRSAYLAQPGKRIHLSHWKTDEDGGYKSEEAAAPVLVKHRERLAKLQEILYAGQGKAVLIVLQGMDTAGKDGTIRHIFSGINPQGCDVTAFKVPTPLERRHDFLWRAHNAAPPLGMIGVFNRSHYEDVLSPRVHKLISGKTVRERFEEINRFEESLFENDVVILKFFLHISRDEQTRQLQARLDNPDKHWKLSEGDFQERRFWPGYEEAYEDLMEATSRRHAPWFVIPADRKWYRNLAISSILVDAMDGLKLKYPEPTFDASAVKL